MADPKHDETFRVIDRRLFTEEGELRKDVAENERRTEEAPARKASQGDTKSPIQGAPGGTSIDAGIHAPANALEASAPLEPEEPSSRSFQMLVDFLTRNAAAMLGGMADPRTGQAFLDLEGARDMIDMLDVVREKTKGNLAKADEELIIEVIGSLKLTFMEISKAAAEQATKKAQGKV